VRALLALLALLEGGASADSEHIPNHAVMFEFDYDSSGDIGHAQAVGGYPSLEACQGAMPAVMGTVVEKLGPSLTPELLCSGIKNRIVIGRQPESKT
jgi:hypothetical protein